MLSSNLPPSSMDKAAVATATLLSLACAWKLYRSRNNLPLPPGPPKLPLVGNLFQMPSFPVWEAYQRWSEEYDSDIIHLDAAGTSIVVLNSAKAINDLLEKRSRIYSSRPPAPMVCDLMGWDWHFGFKVYGDEWRARRRTFLQIFHQKAARQFEPQEIKHTRNLLRRLLDKPEDFLGHLQHHAAAVVMSVAYGLEIKPAHDAYVELADAAMHPLLLALTPGKFWVDSFPMLKYVPSWLPGAGFKKYGEASHQLATAMVTKPFEDGKVIMEQTGVPSFISSALQKLDGKATPKQEQIIREAAGSMYLAGADTTVSAITTFILAMLFAPEAQQKAQEELDRVVPSGRLPDFSDEERLPYTTALVKEALRWNNVAPMALPHVLEVEDEYKGYRIPANTIVYGNVWAVLHDEQVYSEPFKFQPERFLRDGKVSYEDAPDPVTVFFGFGRRICPGRHMAYSSMWITIASVLKMFRISKAIDANGNIIEPTYKYRTGLVTSPEPFPCSIKPRISDAEDLLNHE
ncbi:hypothetical protein PQX77_006117 [Marasmius sp. AFHP31]|nr:hypothetical protein PQX77_006117 [Marasmius sp. AFHP31]